VAVVVPHPDIVVFECRQGNKRQHDGTAGKEKGLCYPS